MVTEKLHHRQLMTITAAAVFGVDILMVQQRIAAIACQDAWISLSLGGLITIVAATAAYYLASLYPDKDFPEIILEICGRFVGRILILFTNIYLLLYSGLSLRIFAQALKMFLVDRTPISLLVFLMGIAICYASYKGINSIGSIIDIIFPISVITIMATLLLSLSQADTIYIKPVLFENTKNVVRAVLPSYSRFTGYNVIQYIFCHTKKSKRSFLYFFAGLIIPIFFYIALTVVSIMVFGPKDLITQIYPTLTLLKTIQFPVTFMERLESFAAILWISIIFLSQIIFNYVTSRDITVFFSINDKFRKYVVLAQFPILLSITLIPENILLVFDYIKKIGLMQNILGLAIIPMLLVIALFKKRKGVSR